MMITASIGNQDNKGARPRLSRMQALASWDCDRPCGQGMKHTSNLLAVMGAQD